MFVAGSVLLDGKVKQIRNLTCFPGQQAASQAGQAIADQSPSQQAGWSRALKFRHPFAVVSGWVKGILNHVKKTARLVQRGIPKEELGILVVE